MYLVGFYSPKERSGVTQISLEVEKRFRERTSLAVAFVCNGKLEREPSNPNTVQQFASLSPRAQKARLAKLKKSFDIVVYDASGAPENDPLDLLAAADRRVVVGDEDDRFAEVLHHLLEFGKAFGQPSKGEVGKIHNDGTYVFRDGPNTMGFAQSKIDAEEMFKALSSDYFVYKLHRQYAEKLDDLVAKAKKIPKDALGHGVYRLGLPFEKAMILAKLVQLREFCGQEYGRALEELLPAAAEKTYQEFLQQLHEEIGVAQISFAPKKR